MSEGQRNVTLTLSFSPDTFDQDELDEALQAAPWLFELSTAEGWVEPLLEAWTLGVDGDLETMRFELKLEEDADPIAPPSPAQAAIDSPWPVLRLSLRPIWNATQRYVTLYPPFRRLVLVAAHLGVAVSGLAYDPAPERRGNARREQAFRTFRHNSLRWLAVLARPS